MGSRWMKQKECNVAFQVFSFTIPYDKIQLSTDLGAGDRPYTIPLLNYPGHFQINIGKTFTWHLLIHELTHVWQGHNSGLAWGYVLNSLLSQAVCEISGTNAYKYTVGKDFNSYNVEQQASIVEDWYIKGCSKSNSRYRYIRDDIWHPETYEAQQGGYDHVTM